jgi:hypothetical protein
MFTIFTPPFVSSKNFSFIDLKTAFLINRRLMKKSSFENVVVVVFIAAWAYLRIICSQSSSPNLKNVENSGKVKKT